MFSNCSAGKDVLVPFCFSQMRTLEENFCMFTSLVLTDEDILSKYKYSMLSGACIAF